MITGGVDLSSLPEPQVIEALEFERVLAEARAALLVLAPELAEPLSVESDPLIKEMQVNAYREVLVRNRINQAARAVMLRFATGADLDNLAALFGVTRLVVVPADDEAIPPVAAVMETDDRFRERIVLALDGYSTAGPVGAYVFHALSASADVKDVNVTSPVPGEVAVAILSREGDGTPSGSLLMDVEAALNADTVRPLCDTVSVGPATVISYAVDATVELAPGTDTVAVLDAARVAVAEYVDQAHRFGGLVARSGLFAALHRPGVIDVTLTSPAADIEALPAEAPFCTATDVVEAVV